MIHGSFAAWPKGGLPRRSPIRVLYGPPIDVAGLKGDALVRRIEQTLRHMHADVRHRSAQLFIRGV